MKEYGYVKGSKELESRTKMLHRTHPEGTFYGITKHKQILVLDPPGFKAISVSDFASEFEIDLETAKEVVNSRGKVALGEIELNVEPKVEDVEVITKDEDGEDSVTPTPEIDYDLLAEKLLSHPQFEEKVRNIAIGVMLEALEVVKEEE